MFEPSTLLRGSLVAVIAALLASCGGGGGSDQQSGGSAVPTGSVSQRPVEQSDLEIASAIYSGARTPAHFLSDDAQPANSIVATAHVKNTDVDTSVSVTAAQYELCANDWNEALNWSEASAQNRPEYADLVATNDDARYFEFGRMRAGSPPLQTRDRVYKCAYLDRSAANLRVSEGPAGTLNARPLNAAQMKQMSEYLWQFTVYNNFGHAVLKSAPPPGTSNAHTLYIASLVRGGISAQCDRIDVIAWTHSVDMTSGAMILTIDDLWTFGARESTGVAQLCQ